MPGPYGIRLHTDVQRIFHEGADTGFGVAVVAYDARGLAPEIFVYRMLPCSPGRDEAQAHFDHVASVVDLAEVPTYAAYPNASPPWLRLPAVDVVVRTRTEAEEFLAIVHEQVGGLVRSLERADDMVAYGDVAFGIPAAGSSSSSDSGA